MKTTLFVSLGALVMVGAGIFALQDSSPAEAQEDMEPTSKPTAKIVAEEVAYQDGDADCTGYIAYDNAMKGRRPVVLIVHDWMGRGEFDQARAEDLAELGYLAFSIDVYGNDTRPTNREEAQKASGQWYGQLEKLHARLNAGMDAALAHDMADADRVAVMGYCFGGMCALELARSGADVHAISFHGSLGNKQPERANNIKGNILVLHGADDPHADMEQVNGLVKEMRNAKVDYEVVLYGGAVHSFTNPKAGNDPSKGSAYDEQANARSWERMQNFFSEVFAE